jgi:hypothetical protein
MGMDPLSLLSELKLGDKFVAEIVKLLVELAKSAIWSKGDEFAGIRSRLDHIQSGVELQLGMWLKSGLTFLLHGETDTARKELIRAESADPRNAVARLYLAMIYAGQGKIDDAKTKVAEAMAINPYIIMLPLADDLPRVDPQSVGNWPAWTRSMDRAVIETTPQYKKSLKGWLNTLPNVVVIRKASLSGGKLIVSWKLRHAVESFSDPSPTDEFEERNLTSLCPRNGAIDWTVQTRDRALLLATPNHVVLSCREGGYEFLRPSDGSVASFMGAEYFRAVFCPNIDTLISTEEFLKSNRAMLSQEFFENHYKQLVDGYLNSTTLLQRLFSPSTQPYYTEMDSNDLEQFYRDRNYNILDRYYIGRPDYDRKDVVEIAFPYSTVGPRFRMRNQWYIKHRSSSYGGGSGPAVTSNYDVSMCEADIACV